MIATFCHVLARGEKPQVVDDKELPLIHVGRIADLLLDLTVDPKPGTFEVPGRPTLVGEVAERLTAIAADYRTRASPGPV